MTTEKSCDDFKIKKYQVEFREKGEGGIYSYIVSSKMEEWALRDAKQMLLRDFPHFNGKECLYKIICLEPEVNKVCDHCREATETAEEIKIQIGGYTDTAYLCPACVGKLMHINEAFLNGEEFVRREEGAESDA